jgi:putative cell wall-binding protein
LIIQRKRVAKRLASGLLAGALALGGLAISGGTASATATVTEDTRISGADRYATADAVAKAMVGTRTDLDAVIIASGENFPDGLAAAALAGAIDKAQGGSPLLLTPAAALKTGTVGTLLAFKTAGATSAIIVGGTNSVSADVEAQVTALGFTVTRIAGANRYETANLIAASVYTNNGATIGTFGGYRTAFLANGNNFPDALAASSWAFNNQHPLFLTDGSSLTAGTKAAMTAAKVQQVVILGGLSAVSAEAATEAAGVSGVITTVRISGDTRYDTATALATTIATVDADYKTRAMLVSGTNFPDALAAGQLAGLASSYAIIPVTDPLPAAVSTWATANQATLSNIRAIGGTTAIPASVVTAMKAAGTIAKLTATITATDGSTAAKVTFSADVNSSTIDAADFVHRRVSGLVVGAVTVGSYTAASAVAGTPASVALTLASAAQPGDTIDLISGGITTTAATGTVAVDAASVTVAADASAPTATIQAYAGATAAASFIWVTTSLNAGSSFAVGDLSITAPPGVFGATLGSPGTCSNISGTTTYKCTVTGSPLLAGHIVSIAKGGLTTSATTPVTNPAVISVAAVSDAVTPTLNSVTYSITGTGGIKASRSTNNATGTNGAVKVSAKAAGVAGNGLKVFTATNGTAGAVACSYSSASKTITLSATATSTAVALANACNADADVAAVLLVEAVTGAGGAFTLDDWAAEVAASGTTAQALTGGEDLITFTATFSEPLSAAADGDFTVQGATVNTIAIKTAAGTDDGRLTGVLTITGTTASTIVPGVTTLTADTAIKDLAGNAVSATGSANVVPVYAAS